MGGEFYSAIIGEKSTGDYTIPYVVKGFRHHVIYFGILFTGSLLNSF